MAMMIDATNKYPNISFSASNKLCCCKVVYKEFVASCAASSYPCPCVSALFKDWLYRDAASGSAAVIVSNKEYIYFCSSRYSTLP